MKVYTLPLDWDLIAPTLRAFRVDFPKAIIEDIRIRNDGHKTMVIQIIFMEV